ncbi:MAG: efflux RND transporter permease subunit, partial [Polyangiaceae bacterium]
EVDAVEQAKAYLDTKIQRGELQLPEGVSYAFAGSYENQLRSERRLAVLVPLAIALIVLLIYLQFRRLSTTLIIFSGVFLAVSGGFILIWLYGKGWFLDVSVADISLREVFRVRPTNMSVAVWVGFIALVGIATDDGVVLSTYLHQLFDRGDAPTTVDEVKARVLEAGCRRSRACIMTTATTILALLPVVTATGRGADVMLPMALPALGGMTIEFTSLFLVPVLFSLVREREARKRSEQV